MKKILVMLLLAAVAIGCRAEYVVGEGGYHHHHHHHHYHHEAVVVPVVPPLPVPNATQSAYLYAQMNQLEHPFYQFETHSTPHPYLGVKMAEPTGRRFGEECP